MEEEEKEKSTSIRMMNPTILSPYLTSATSIIIIPRSSSPSPQTHPRSPPKKFLIHISLLSSHPTLFHSLIPILPTPTTIPTLISSRMLRREWRWEFENDIGTMEGNGFGDEDGKIEIPVRVCLPPGGVREFELRVDGGEDVFAMFVEWLYNGLEGWDLRSERGRTGSAEYDIQLLARLWVFASKIRIPKCMDDCLKGISILRSQPGGMGMRGILKIMAWVYENTEKESELRCFLIDQCARFLDPKVLDGGLEGDRGVPRMALCDLVGRMRGLMMMTEGAIH